MVPNPAKKTAAAAVKAARKTLADAEAARQRKLGECAQQDDEREHPNQQARAEQHGLAGEVESPQLPDEAFGKRSFEPVPRRRQSFAARRTRWRCFPPSGRLTILTVGLHHHAALFRRLVIELARNPAFLGSRQLKLTNSLVGGWQCTVRSTSGLSSRAR
jgi:hypothetical protein